MELFNKMVFLIPALNPTDSFLQLLEMLRLNEVISSNNIVVVDDGSRGENTHYFDIAEQKYGTHVLHHSENEGKESALKTGFNYVLENFEDYDGVVTLHLNGKHSIDTIQRGVNLFYKENEAIVFGTRYYKYPDGQEQEVDWTKTYSESVLQAITGLEFKNRKTGMMVLPMTYIDELIQIEGEDESYEVNVALFARNNQIRRLQVLIETIYMEDEVDAGEEKPSEEADENENQEGKNPLLRFFNYNAVFLKYIVSAVTTFIIDNGLFTIVLALFMVDTFVGITISTGIARIVSSVVNYLMNRFFVFKGAAEESTLKFFLLTAVKIIVSAILVSMANSVFTFIHTTILKIIVDGLLFTISYYIQKKYIFGEEARDS